MLQQMNVLFLGVLTFSKANPIIASALGLWGLSALTFFLKDVPTQAWKFVKRQCTTTLDLNSQDLVFHEFLEWLSVNKMNRYVRTFNINSGLHHSSYYRRSRGDKGISLGYGRTWFSHKGNLFYILRNKETSNATDITKETISITVLGRNQEIFKELFQEAKTKKEEDTEHTTVYNFTMEKGWEPCCKNYKRLPETVIVTNEVQTSLYGTIDTFISSKDWYRSNGIPYKLGILLSGPPGTGKTSLIKALCAKYDRDLFTLNIGSMSDDTFLKAISGAPEKSIIAIEDIDGYGISMNREDKQEKKPMTVSMSGLLNGLDGVASPEDLIIIATTNHVDKLDPALIRDGRFDLKLVIENMDLDTVFRYLGSKYKDFVAPVNVQLKPGISPATIQRLVFTNRKDYRKVLDQICVYYSHQQTAQRYL